MNVADFQIKRISPMLAVAEMEVTIAFYTSVLGFETLMKSSSYSVVGRDGATIHFMLAANDQVLEAVRGHTEIYIEVSDIALLWDHVSHYRQTYRIRELFDRDYGMREFHIADPNGCLVFVGQRIA